MSKTFMPRVEKISQQLNAYLKNPVSFYKPVFTDQELELIRDAFDEKYGNPASKVAPAPSHVGSIPVSTPILKRFKKALMGVYDSLSDEERKELRHEIGLTKETNCDSDIYDISKMLEMRVEQDCRNR